MLTRRLVIQSGLATIAAPAVLRAQTLSGTVTLMTYTGIFQDNYTKAVVEPFQQAHPGVKVNFVSAGTSAQMVGAVRAQKADPQTDVVIMDVTTSSIGNAEGLFEKLTPAEFPVLGDVRGPGLMIGVEFGRSGREPLPDLAKAVQQACLDRQLLLLTCGAYGNTVRWIPPLVAGEEQIADALSIFGDSVAQAAGKMGS